MVDNNQLKYAFEYVLVLETQQLDVIIMLGQIKFLQICEGPWGKSWLSMHAPENLISLFPLEKCGTSLLAHFLFYQKHFWPRFSLEMFLW